MIRKKITALSLLLTLGVIWGTGYSIAHFAMTNGVSALGYSFWQCVGPAILIGLISIKHHSKNTLTTHHLRYYLICGLTGIVIPNTTMYFAASYLPAGLLAVIVNTVPIIAYPIAILANVEHFQWRRFAGIVAAISGLMLIIIPKASLPTSQMLPWIMISLITPSSFAFCSVYIARFRPPHTDSLALAAGTLIASSVLLAPIIIGSGHFYSGHFPFTTADWVILLEIILSSAGYVLFFQLIKIAGPVYYSLVDTIVSLTGLFWGYVIFHEHLNQWTLPAVLLILLGLSLVINRRKTN